MRKTITAFMAALTFGGALAAAAAPAQARPHGRYYDRHDHRDNDAGVAVAAGVVGLALGAALASSNNRGGYYDRGYYDRGYNGGYYDRRYYGRGYDNRYYGGGYGYDRGYYDNYRVCTSKRWVWDPYVGRRVLVKQRYAC